MAIETIQNETEKSENVLNKYEIHSEMWNHLNQTNIHVTEVLEEKRKSKTIVEKIIDIF
jgi:CRISPR/Cas system endoribonuclease Cas6 (RAMP superfamily)